MRCDALSCPSEFINILDLSMKFKSLTFTTLRSGLNLLSSAIKETQ